jgi:pimeloyl-ACP methyl ester carboxylesterase
MPDAQLTNGRVYYSEHGSGEPLILMATDDDIASLPHQLDFFGALPNAELAIVPGTSHFLLQEKPALVNAILLDFLANDPVATIAPVRRAAAAT